MKLDKNAREKIMTLWEKRVRASSAAADAQDSSCLRDHLPEFLDRMISSLKREQTLSEAKAKEKLSEIHGKERSLIDEYSLEQVLREYSILRVALIEVLCTDAPIDLDDQIIMHGLIDEAEMIAGHKFSETRRLKAEVLTKELQQSNEDLERFAAIAAHDLRSPLTTIYRFVELIMSEIEVKNAEVKEYFSFVKSATKSMLLLIDRLLSYATIGKSELKIESLDLNIVVGDVVAKLNQVILESGSKVIYDNLPTIKGDVSIVSQIFQNLIANSVKFRSSKAPLIKICLEKEDKEHFTLSVTDNGIGFKKRQTEVIFEPFKRLGDNEKYEGAGLGLATARRSVEILGGRIWAESEEGKGAKFLFTVPKGKVESI